MMTFILSHNLFLSVISNGVNVEYKKAQGEAINNEILQIEIQSSETEIKTLWIKNEAAIAKVAKPNGELSLAENTVAWTKHPLQASNIPSSALIVGTALQVEMNDAKLSLSDNRAIDAQGNLWLKVDVLDDKNRKRSGWVLVNGEGAKRVCCWDWFDFTQIKETATLKEIYLDADKSLKRNKDNHSLSQYKATIKETLSILDKQYFVETNIYTSIKEASFKGIADKPMLFTALSRLLVNYESEWYSEIDAEGKLPEWEELNSEMTEDAKNLLGYLQTGDEAKFDAYLSSVGKAKDSPEAKGFETLRREISRFPADYKESPSEKLTKAQFESYAKMEALEKQVTAWEKTKEKIKKMLWWDDVAKGLSKLNQQNDTPPKNGEATSTPTTEADTTPPATLSADGKAWFVHPVAMMDYFTRVGIVTYHIYHDGKIEKHIPEKILTGYEQKYKYVYHDKNKKTHELGIFTVHVTKAMARGNIPQTHNVELINVKEFEKGYISSDGSIKAKFATFNSDSHRWYINPDCFAGLLGAMLELNADYLGFNGFSTHDAKSVQSRSHINGIAGDLRYISTKRNGELTWLSYSSFDFDEQEKFNTALYKFGWARTSLMYSEYFTYKKQPNTLLKYTKHMKKAPPNGYDHYHHLHICGFDFNLIINVQD
ncbi:hypothetical protein ACGH6Q_11835 [Gilliamella sp. BG2]|uniref:hypothetical protein n=1 Tax=Gilliamella sp. BG2 TaxID=3351509 RepID=UPI0039872C44